MSKLSTKKLLDNALSVLYEHAYDLGEYKEWLFKIGFTKEQVEKEMKKCGFED